MDMNKLLDCNIHHIQFQSFHFHRTNHHKILRNGLEFLLLLEDKYNEFPIRQSPHNKHSLCKRVEQCNHMLRYWFQLDLVRMFHKNRLHTNRINHNPNKNVPRKFRMGRMLEAVEEQEEEDPVAEEVADPEVAEVAAEQEQQE